MVNNNNDNGYNCNEIMLRYCYNKDDNDSDNNVNSATYATRVNNKENKTTKHVSSLLSMRAKEIIAIPIQG